MAKRRIDPGEGMVVLCLWRDAVERGEEPTCAVVLTTVRFTLEELDISHPDRAVEVRVPPAGAVQILPGTTYRRGTPPAVMEIGARTWLSLACGLLTWDETVAASRISASGERTDLGSLLSVVWMQGRGIGLWGSGPGLGYAEARLELRSKPLL